MTLKVRYALLIFLSLMLTHLFVCYIQKLHRAPVQPLLFVWSKQWFIWPPAIYGCCTRHWARVCFLPLATYCCLSLLTISGTVNLSCWLSLFLVCSASLSGGELYSLHDIAIQEGCFTSLIVEPVVDEVTERHTWVKVQICYQKSTLVKD